MTRSPTHQDAALRERFLFALGALDNLQRAEGDLPLGRAARVAGEELRGAWERGAEEAAQVVVRAERVVRSLAARRNAKVEPMPSLAEMERRFERTIAAFDQCIAQVEGNWSWWDLLGGPGMVMSTQRIRELEAVQARADRKQLVAQWAASKTDEERWELVRRGERWFGINAETLGGCRGVTPSTSAAIVEQARDVVSTTLGAVKEAGKEALAAVGQPLLYAGLGIGGVLVVAALARRR